MKRLTACPKDKTDPSKWSLSLLFKASAIKYFEMISALRIKNLRALRDTGEIPLTKLNVLVGKNSSGKSTFARVFPLLRQSVEAETTGPILWYGRFVDFGSFAEAISIGSDTKTIEVDFSLDYPITRDDIGSRPSLGRTYPIYRRFNISKEKSNARVQICLERSGGSESAHIASFLVELYGLEIEIRTQNGGQQASQIRIGDHIWEPNEDTRAYLAPGAIFPKINFARRRKLRIKNTERRVWRFEGNPFRSLLEVSLWSRVHGRTQKERIERIANQLYIASPEEFTERLKVMSGAPSSWYRSTQNLSPNSRYIERLRQFTFGVRLPEIFRDLDEIAKNFFSNIRYIEPLRATAERYYRRQDLAVEEIDSKGGNVAMFLNSLADYESLEFRNWMDEIFGAHVYSESESGHISLRLRERHSETSVNIADVGFGFSQVLPLAVQLWSAAYKPRQRTPSSNTWLRSGDTSAIVIEQPELHLHPEFQARLADMFVETLNVATERGNPLKIIIETHSSALINRLGEFVSQNDLSHEDVNVCLFERVSSDLFSMVRITKFDTNGILENWPFGFFESV